MTRDLEELREFAAQEYRSLVQQDPARVAAHYAVEGSLTINHGTPAVGRAAITEAARSSWPGGTGRKVRISGFEEDNRRRRPIAPSLGPYDQADSDRQLAADGS
jgi:hypothetical protein